MNVRVGSSVGVWCLWRLWTAVLKQSLVQKVLHVQQVFNCRAVLILCCDEVGGHGGQGISWYHMHTTSATLRHEGDVIQGIHVSAAAITQIYNPTKITTIQRGEQLVSKLLTIHLASVGELVWENMTISWKCIYFRWYFQRLFWGKIKNDKTHYVSNLKSCWVQKTICG